MKAIIKQAECTRAESDFDVYYQYMIELSAVNAEKALAEEILLFLRKEKGLSQLQMEDVIELEEEVLFNLRVFALNRQGIYIYI